MLAALAAGAVVRADDFNNIQFPIVELGGCESKEACKIYCDQPENLGACIAFADKNDLMTDSEIQEAEVIANLDEINGPGGCSTEEECESYCDNIQHLNECLVFAREHNLMNEQELHEAELVAQALAAGVGIVLSHTT